PRRLQALRFFFFHISTKPSPPLLIQVGLYFPLISVDLLLFNVKLEALTAAAARSRYPHFNFKLKAQSILTILVGIDSPPPPKSKPI
ncbi:hypothetical protein CCACVL1_19674, partial [Corchorus capsularis]